MVEMPIELDTLFELFQHLGVGGIFLYMWLRERSDHDKTRVKFEECLRENGD